MSRKLDIHNYKKRLEATLRRIECSDISDKNKELLSKYHNQLVLEGLSIARIERYLSILKLIVQRIDKDIVDYTIDDIKKYVCEIQQNDYSPYTKQLYKVSLKKFFRWLKPAENNDYPPEVKWISLKISRCERKLPATHASGSLSLS